MNQTTSMKKEDIKKLAEESPCLCFQVRKAAKLITAVYEKMLKPYALTAPQAAFLNAVHMFGPLTVNELAEALATDRTTLTRNLKILERDGFILVIAGVDRRSKEISVTRKGKDTAVELTDVFKAFQTRLNKEVGQQRITDLCQEMCAVMHQIEDF